MNINIDKIKKIVFGAGDIALDYYYSKNTSYDLKADNSVVTEADKKVEKFLIKNLTEIFPAKIIGEESGQYYSESNSKYLWALDPVDGTHSFASKLPGWCVSVGLLKNNKPYLGFVYIPVINEFYWGGKDFGSYLNNKKLVNFSLDKKNHEKNFNVFIDSKGAKNISPEFKGKVRSYGSTAIHMVFLAKGAGIAAYSCPVSIWDLAGACAVLEGLNIPVNYADGEKLELKDMIDGSKSKKHILAGVNQEVINHQIIDFGI
ncbi:MAG: inositol monophosphatase family protein [Candidatus Muiribacteriota bacterium]